MIPILQRRKWTLKQKSWDLISGSSMASVPSRTQLNSEEDASLGYCRGHVCPSKHTRVCSDVSPPPCLARNILIDRTAVSPQDRAITHQVGGIIPLYLSLRMTLPTPDCEPVCVCPFPVSCHPRRVPWPCVAVGEYG